MEQLLSVMKRRTEIKFLIILWETRKLERKIGRRGVENECDLAKVMGSKAPLLTTIDEGPDDGGG